MEREGCDRRGRQQRSESPCPAVWQKCWPGRAPQWLSEDCWNENHISASDFFTSHYLSSRFSCPSMPSSCLRASTALAVVWFSLVDYNLCSCPPFWKKISFPIFAPFFLPSLCSVPPSSHFFPPLSLSLSKSWLITVCYELTVLPFILYQWLWQHIVKLPNKAWCAFNLTGKSISGKVFLLA